MGNVVEPETVAPEGVYVDNRRPTYTAKQKQAALAHVDSGMSHREAAGHIGATAGTIGRWVNQRKELLKRTPILNAYGEEMERLRLEALARQRRLQLPAEELARGLAGLLDQLRRF